ECFRLARPMPAQLVEKIAHRRNSLALHLRLELFQGRIPSRADKRCVNLFRLCSGSGLVGSLQIEQLATASPLDSCCPILSALRSPVPRITRLENHGLPVTGIRLAEILLGHFLATFFVHN